MFRLIIGLPLLFMLGMFLFLGFVAMLAWLCSRED
jgi:hypothetical protein